MNSLRSWSWRWSVETPADVALIGFGDGPLGVPPGVRLVVRISAGDGRDVESELDAVASAAPWAILAPRCRSGADIERLGVKLGVREARLGLEAGSIRVAATVGDDAAGLLRIASFTGASPRLVALIADGRALRDEFARSLVVLAAEAAGVVAILGPRAEKFDAAAVRAEAEAAAAEGFAGRIAGTAEEVAIYNSAFAAKPPAASSSA